MEKEIARITCEELKAVLDEAVPVVIVDTRPRGNYAGQHLPGAINIPYDPAADPMERDMMLALLPGDRLTVLYCD